MNCLICKNKTAFVKKFFGSDLLHCPNCGFDFVSPLIKVASESSNENIIMTDESFTSNIINRYERNLPYYQKLAKKKYDYLSHKLGKKKFSLLEIGCGVAGMAEELMKNGVDYYGLDIDKRVVDFAKGRGISCDMLDFADMDTTKKFDAIICSQVLEHIVDPFAFVDKVKNHLNDGGLFVFDIPNGGSLSSMVYKVITKKTRYAGIIYPYHLYSYTEEALSRLVAHSFSSYNVLKRSSLHDTFGQATPIKGLGYAYMKVSALLKRPSLLVGICRK